MRREALLYAYRFSVRRSFDYGLMPFAQDDNVFLYLLLFNYAKEQNL